MASAIRGRFSASSDYVRLYMAQVQIHELFRVPLMLSGAFYDFLLKVVLKDLDEYNKFVFEKLTKVHGIVKMQSSFVLSEIMYKTAFGYKAVIIR